MLETMSKNTPFSSRLVASSAARINSVDLSTCTTYDAAGSSFIHDSDKCFFLDRFSAAVQTLPEELSGTDANEQYVKHMLKTNRS